MVKVTTCQYCEEQVQLILDLADYDINTIEDYESSNEVLCDNCINHEVNYTL